MSANPWLKHRRGSPQSVPESAATASAPALRHYPTATPRQSGCSASCAVTEPPHVDRAKARYPDLDIPEVPGDKPQTFFGSKKESNEETKLDAAIIEYDAGLSRPQAEQKTATCRYCKRWCGTRSGGGWCVVTVPAVQRDAAESCEQFKVMKVQP